MPKKKVFSSLISPGPSISIDKDITALSSIKLPGESVDEHNYQEQANIILSGDEIRQQNENL